MSYDARYARTNFFLFFVLLSLGLGMDEMDMVVVMSMDMEGLYVCGWVGVFRSGAMGKWEMVGKR